MSHSNIDNVNFVDPCVGIPLDDIHPLSLRATSHVARSRNLPILKHAFVNIFGAIEMMDGLGYHHSRFMNLVECCRTVVPTQQTAGELRHEAVAYLNRLGQFWSFSKSDIVKKHCPNSDDVLPTFSKLIVFRNKHTAHRSIDDPRNGDTEGLQKMNAISLSIMGPQFFSPKPGCAPTVISTINTDQELDELRCSLYRNEYWGFQIYDVKNSTHVNIYLERDHDLLMQEAYNLIGILLPLSKES